MYVVAQLEKKSPYYAVLIRLRLAVLSSPPILSLLQDEGGDSAGLFLRTLLRRSIAHRTARPRLTVPPPTPPGPPSSPFSHRPPARCTPPSAPAAAALLMYVPINHLVRIAIVESFELQHILGLCNLPESRGRILLIGGLGCGMCPGRFISFWRCL